MQTAEDARFYAISAPLEKELKVSDKPIVFQFTVKHEQKIDCGGGYLKLLPEFSPTTSTVMPSTLSCSARSAATVLARLT